MRFMSLDTETTGFGKDARILELGLVFYEDGVEVTSWFSRFFPKDVDWSNPRVGEALEINHLTLNDLKGSPDFSQAIDSVHHFLARFDVWVAHNMKFDLRMLRQEYNRAGRALPKTKFKVCTMELDKKLSPANMYGMDKVASRYGVELVNAHTALADARACGEVFHRMQSHPRYNDTLLVPFGG